MHAQVQYKYYMHNAYAYAACVHDSGAARLLQLDGGNGRPLVLVALNEGEGPRPEPPRRVNRPLSAARRQPLKRAAREAGCARVVGSLGRHRPALRRLDVVPGGAEF